VRREAELFDTVHDSLDLRLERVLFHHDDHQDTSGQRPIGTATVGGQASDFNDVSEFVARLKKLTGAKFMVMEQDVQEIEDGGKSDFHYDNMKWTPTKVDRMLHDGDVVELGGVKLTEHLTAGHTKGCTTWTLNTGGKNVVIVGSPNVNDGYKLVHNTKYPGIIADYQKTFQVLQSLPCDVFLGAHGAYYGLDAKYPKLKAGNANAFVTVIAPRL